MKKRTIVAIFLLLQLPASIHAMQYKNKAINRMHKRREFAIKNKTYIPSCTTNTILRVRKLAKHGHVEKAKRVIQAYDKNNPMSPLLIKTLRLLKVEYKDIKMLLELYSNEEINKIFYIYDDNKTALSIVCESDSYCKQNFVNLIISYCTLKTINLKDRYGNTNLTLFIGIGKPKQKNELKHFLSFCDSKSISDASQCFEKKAFVKKKLTNIEINSLKLLMENGLSLQQKMGTRHRKHFATKTQSIGHTTRPKSEQSKYINLTIDYDNSENKIDFIKSKKNMKEYVDILRLAFSRSVGEIAKGLKYTETTFFKFYKQLSSNERKAIKEIIQLVQENIILTDIKNIARPFKEFLLQSIFLQQEANKKRNEKKLIDTKIICQEY